MPDLETKNIILQLSSESMGQGDPELGEVLINSFFDVISQMKTNITGIVLYNSAVKLACEGSAILDVLNEMEKQGINILSCGTCLNHYNIKDKFVSGKISNMLEITQTLFEADQVLPL